MPVDWENEYRKWHPEVEDYGSGRLARDEPVLNKGKALQDAMAAETGQTQGKDKWRELYDWLGTQASSRDKLADDPWTRDSTSLAASYQSDTLLYVRDQMRQKDPSLPLEDIDDP